MIYNMKPLKMLNLKHKHMDIDSDNVNHITQQN